METVLWGAGLCGSAVRQLWFTPCVIKGTELPRCFVELTKSVVRGKSTADLGSPLQTRLSELSDLGGLLLTQRVWEVESRVIYLRDASRCSRAASPTG